MANNPVWYPPGRGEVRCEASRCIMPSRIIAEADTYPEAEEIAEYEFDAYQHRGDQASGDWMHRECYDAYVAEMVGPFQSRKVREYHEAYVNYMAEAEVDPVSAYLRAKGEL